ncbi:MAG: M1 family metallopeptidase, partial [Pseudomonadota bacterium]
MPNLRTLACALVVTLSFTATAAARDVHSYAEPDKFRHGHIELDLAVDFDAKRLIGVASLHIERTERGRSRLLKLDTRDLTIRSVWLNDKRDAPLPFELGADDDVLGRELIVHLPKRAGSRFVVNLQYETAPGASGLQWLSARQTAGGGQPFLFSQSQAIHARSWVPLQDTPSVRFTYAARVVTPPDLLAVMSADNDPDTARDGDYRFRMDQPIPSYLLAIAAGNLDFAPIGPRTGIYAEPELLAAAVAEFEDTERMLEIGEQLFGPYRWERYDLLILPPSFPFGGMENPRLSFITPTVLAGDKSLVGLIAHELAHSWSGNLVTNATWRDLWLNEGFTVFLEARIMEALYGERRRRMEERLGYEDLIENFDTLEPEAEVLAIDLEDQDPDLVFSQVPYEKGRLLLVWLEQAVGREAMTEFLETYFDEFAFRSITTEDFLSYLDENLLTQTTAVSLDDVREWVFEPGLPGDAPVPSADVFAPIDAARAGFLAGDLAAADIDAGDWSTQDWLYFLNNLPETLSESQLVELDAAFDLTAAGNNEIAHSWLRIAIRNDYRAAWPRLERYLLGIGRNKLVRPLYTDLMATDDGAAFARDVFER